VGGVGDTCFVQSLAKWSRCFRGSWLAITTNNGGDTGM
jgi:hypothetical protein